MPSDQASDIFTRFKLSYGGWTELSQMMDKLEFLRLQALSKYCYKTSISRV